MRSRPTIAPERLYVILWKAFYAVEQHDRRSMAALGFRNDSDFAVLEVLLAKGPLAVNDIGRRVLLTSGAVTTAIDRAARRGLVRRTTSRADRRVVLVELTKAGRALIGGAVKTHFRHLATALSGLTPAEQRKLGNLLRKLGQHAARLNEEAVVGC